MSLNKPYFLAAISILIIEILIAIFIKTGFIRHTFGDYLVVILVYCFVKSIINIPSKQAAIGVLIFAYFVEFLQYLNMVSLLNLQEHTILKTIIGTTFSIQDLVAYTFGFITLLIFEQKQHNHG